MIPNSWALPGVQDSTVLTVVNLIRTQWDLCCKEQLTEEEILGLALVPADQWYKSIGLWFQNSCCSSLLGIYGFQQWYQCLTCMKWKCRFAYTSSHSLSESGFSHSVSSWPFQWFFCLSKTQRSKRGRFKRPEEELWIRFRRSVGPLAENKRK
jgi:hypothetical protein